MGFKDDVSEDVGRESRPPRLWQRALDLLTEKGENPQDLIDLVESDERNAGAIQRQLRERGLRVGIGTVSSWKRGEQR